MTAGMAGFGSDSEVRDTNDDAWPFATGSVVGYRWWTYQVHSSYCPRAVNAWGTCLCGITGTPGELRGSFDKEWHGARMEAQCPCACQRVLDNPLACGCGFWAYWRLPFSRKETARYTWPVAGRIEGSGRVVIGEKGFRCERARITHLAVYPETPARVARELKEKFGVPVLIAGKGRFGVNPVIRALSRKTKADPQYGPLPMSFRKVVRIITGF